MRVACVAAASNGNSRDVVRSFPKRMARESCTSD